MHYQMIEHMTKHSKYYYEFDRNMDTTTEVNPKMFLGKEDLGLVDYSRDKIPPYYVGKTYGYEARKVVEDFELSYNIGTAVTYLLRAMKKHDNPKDCIQKAINHLEFELDKVKNEKTNL